MTIGCSSDRERAAPGVASSASVAPSTSSSTTSTVPLRPTSTTSTTYAPGTVEGQVEAAYLRGWDVYADQVWNLELDEAALSEVLAGGQLEVTAQEIRDRIAEGRASWVRSDRQIQVVVDVELGRAVVLDAWRNHQVLIDPVTKQPVEADPDEEIADQIALELVDGVWKTVMITRFE
ncbi:MAG: hypothetical protein AB7L84_09280 [Acidimicrobiia bacterium]